MRPDLTEDTGLSCNRPDTQEWIAQAKLIRCPAPLPETTPDPVLIKMLEVAPSEEGKGQHRKTTTSAKEACSKGGIEGPSLQGEKRTASEDPEAKASKRGRKSPEGPVPGRAPAAQSPQRNQPSSETSDLSPSQ